VKLTPSMAETLARHGISEPVCGAYVGDGWLLLVDKLLEDLVALGWDRDLKQVKEKFGTLRVYVGQATPEMYARIRTAEMASATICEMCGAPGTIQENPRKTWLQCCCANCQAKRK